MRRFAAVAVAFGVAVCVTHVARAAEPFAKVGFFGAQMLTLPRGVRSIGMGATGTSDASGFATGYFNPASVAYVDATSLSGSYEDMFMDMSLSDVLITSPLPFHAASRTSPWRFGGSLGYTRLNLAPQTQRTIFLPEGTGRTIDLDDWLLSAMGAASWTHGITTLAVGGTTRFVQLSGVSGDPTAWTFDVGALASFAIDLDGGTIRPRLGYALQNLDTGISYDERGYAIENKHRGGFGFDFMMPSAMVWGRSVPPAALSFDYDRIDGETHSSPHFSSGAEVAVVELLRFRYGVIDDNYTTYGLGLGWDYGHVLFRVDYAHVEPEGLADFFDLDLDRDTFGALIGVRW